MGKVFRIVLVFQLLVVSFFVAAGQDLGSSNKIFGDKEQEKKASTASSAKKTTSTKAKSSRKSAGTANKIRIAPKTSVPVRTDPAKDPEKLASYEKLLAEADSARRGREFAAAEAAYQRAHSMMLNDARAPFGLGSSYEEQYKWEMAENAFREAVEIEPKNVLALAAISRALSRPVAAPNLSERYEESERLARKAVDLDPSDPIAVDQLGIALETLGLIGQEAENAYRKAIELAPSNATTYAHLGRLLRKRGLASESEAAFAKAKSNATDSDSLTAVAEVMQSEQHYAASLPLLKDAIKLNARNVGALLLAGRALIVTGDLAEAESYLDRAVKASPACFDGYSSLAKLYLRQGKVALAENALLRASQFVTKYDRSILARQFDVVGDEYANEGNTKNAQRAYRKSLELDPDRASVAAKLAKISKS